MFFCAELNFFVDDPLQKVVAKADVFDCRALVPVERIAVVVKEFGAVMLLDVYAEILKFFDEFLSLSFAEHIFLRIGDETYRELLVDVSERSKHVYVLIFIKLFDVNTAEIEQHFIRKIEGHFLSESFADVVDAAIEHCRTEFEVGRHPESRLQILVCGNASEHCGIITACRVARNAHIVKVEIVLLRIFANPVERVYEMLQSLREEIFRPQTVVDVDNKETFVCRPFCKASAVVLVACHKSAAMDVEEHGIFFVSVFFDEISVELFGIVFSVGDIGLHFKFYVFKAEHFLVVLSTVEQFVDCHEQKLRKCHNVHPLRMIFVIKLF